MYRTFYTLLRCFFFENRIKNKKVAKLQIAISQNAFRIAPLYSISLAQQIIAVNIFVHSCRTSIVRTICLSLSLCPFLLLSRSLSLSISPSFAFSLSACTLQRIRRTELKAMEQSFSPHSFSLSVSLFFI